MAAESVYWKPLGNLYFVEVDLGGCGDAIFHIKTQCQYHTKCSTNIKTPEAV